MSESTEFSTGRLEYLPLDGYVHDWLIAGPLATPIDDLHGHTTENLHRRVLAQRRDLGEKRLDPPAERGALTVAGLDGQPASLMWQARRSHDDHMLDLSGFHATYHHVAVWAYVQIVCPSSHETSLDLGVFGPATIWLNDTAPHRFEGLDGGLTTVSIPVRLDEGVNLLLVRLETVAVGAYALGVRLFIAAAEAGDLRLVLPTLVTPVERRQKLAEVMDHAYLMRDVFHRDDTLEVHWSPDLPQTDALGVRLQTPGGRIYAEALPIVQRRATTPLKRSLRIPEGEYVVQLMPQAEEYYTQEMRITRRLPLQVVDGEFSSVYYGDWDQRRREALRDATRRTGDIYAELAKLALGQWEQVNTASIRRALTRVQQHAVCSDRDLLALTAIATYHGDDAVLPRETQVALAEGICQAKFSPDGTPDGLDFAGEGHGLLTAVCELLAGQLYGDTEFAVSGRRGHWHQSEGERKTLEWLGVHARTGMVAWDACEVIADVVAALSQLVELAERDDVAEMAAAMLDKIAFGLAVHSLRGVFGASQGNTQANWIRSARLSPVSGLLRLLWGTGSWNAHCRAQVCLAMATGYELPEIIAAVGLDSATEAWTLEQDACVVDGVTRAVNRAVYRTPDFMLASAQDYRPGQAGHSEHIWQATLGPDALVYVTAPGCSSTSDAFCPNFWRGNAVLPRVAQWRDLLVAVYRGAEQGRLDFTHAYFPAAVFDECMVADGWACARKGNGYLALAASNGLAFITSGDTAHRELRSPGRDGVWLCQMGRADTDGEFADFAAKVRSLSISFDHDRIELTSLRGQSVQFGRTGAFMVDGESRPLTGYAHTDGPYGKAGLPARALDITFREHRMRLDLDMDQAEAGQGEIE